MFKELVPDNISHDVVEALEELLRGAKAGQITGLAFAATMRRQRYMANLAGSRAAGRALFSGTRARSAMDFINSIAHNTNLDAARRDDLAEVFPVIGSINTMRDFLTHHVNGSLIDSDDDQPTLRKVSNADTAARAGKGQTFWIDSSLVNQMCDDLTECCWRMIAHTEDNTKPFQRGVGPTGRPQPWLYKSPQPSSTATRQRTPPAS